MSSCTTRRGRSWSRRCSRASSTRWSDADCAIAAARVTDTIKEADGRRRRRHARPLAPVGGADAAGLPPRGAGGGAGRRRRRCWRSATDDAWLVERAGGTVRVVESSPANFKVTTPHDLRVRRAAARSSACDPDSHAMLTDYHVHLRPDDPGTRRPPDTSPPPTPSATARPPTERGVAELGRRRARPPLHRRARRLAAPVLARERRRRPRSLRRVRARGDRPAARASRPTTSAAARTGWRRCSSSTTGTTSSARCTSSAITPSTSTTRPTSGATRSTPERVWTRYFEALAESALTGLFDIIAHPDLVKIWGTGRPYPAKDLRYFYEPAVEAMLDARRGDGGLHRRAAQAGRRDLPGAAVSSRWRSTPASRSRCPATRTVPEQLAFRLRGRRSSCSRSAA